MKSNMVMANRVQAETEEEDCYFHNILCKYQQCEKGQRFRWLQQLLVDIIFNSTMMLLNGAYTVADMFVAKHKVLRLSIPSPTHNFPVNLCILRTLS